MNNINIDKILFSNEISYSYFQKEKKNINKNVLINNNANLVLIEPLKDSYSCKAYLQKTQNLKLKDEYLKHTYKNYFLIKKNSITMVPLLSNLYLIINIINSQERSNLLNGLFFYKKQNQLVVKIGGLYSFILPLYFSNSLIKAKKLAGQQPFNIFKNIFFLLKNSLTINRLTNAALKFMVHTKLINKATTQNVGTINKKNILKGKLFICYGYKKYKN